MAPLPSDYGQIRSVADPLVCVPSGSAAPTKSPSDRSKGSLARTSMVRDLIPGGTSPIPRHRGSAITVPRVRLSALNRSSTLTLPAFQDSGSSGSGKNPHLSGYSLDSARRDFLSPTSWSGGKFFPKGALETPNLVPELGIAFSQRTAIDPAFRKFRFGVRNQSFQEGPHPESPPMHPMRRSEIFVREQRFWGAVQTADLNTT